MLKQSQLLANLESYNAVLINQGKEQKERMELLRQLAVQQLKTLESVSLDNLPRLEEKMWWNRVLNWGIVISLI